METNQPHSGGTDGGNESDAGPRERVGVAAQGARTEAATVAKDAKHEAVEVAHEAESEIRDVVEEARRAVHDEADKQTHAVSSSLRTLAHDFERMGSGADGETAAPDYVNRLGRSLGSLADRLDDRGVDGALDELRDVARRHPGMFLAGAAASGFAVARIVRHANAPSSGDGAGTPQAAGTTPTGAGEVTPYGRSQMRGAGQDEVDLRDEYTERQGQAPQLQNDVQEWARP